MTFEDWWKINFDMDEGAMRDAVEDFLKPYCRQAFEAGAGAANKAITDLAAIQAAQRAGAESGIRYIAKDR